MLDKMAVIAAAAFSLALSATAQSQTAGSEPARGPSLGAASNFVHGRGAGMVESLRLLGVRSVRDGTRWNLSERSPGVYAFDDPRLNFPRLLGDAGVDVSVNLTWGNPLFDDGDTPYSEAGVAAFGRFAGALVARFPQISSLEVGNEMNGVNFVKGPLKEMEGLERARAYVPLLAAAATEARRARPGIRISGGATHSIAAAFIWEILDAGGAAYLDTLAIHPYTTPAEQLVRQIAVLRRHPAAARLPIEATEFGDSDPARAGDHFVRNYCQMALAGVSRAIWYPLNERGDEMAPLASRNGSVTTAGRAYRLIAQRMEGRPVVDAAADPFTYGCRFGDDVLVLWGEPREIDIADGVAVIGSTGDPVAPPFRLSADAPLVFVAASGGIKDAVRLAPHRLIADSYDQFAYPDAEEDKPEGDAFERFARRGETVIPLVTLPGQERGGVPWTPYRGNPQFRALRLGAETLNPEGGASRAIGIVHRFVAPEAMRVDVEANFKLLRDTGDGITVTVLKNADPIFEQAGLEPIDVRLASIELAAGEALDLIVGPGQSSDNDLTTYRIRLLRSEP